MLLFEDEVEDEEDGVDEVVETEPPPDEGVITVPWLLSIFELIVKLDERLLPDVIKTGETLICTEPEIELPG